MLYHWATHRFSLRRIEVKCIIKVKAPMIQSLDFCPPQWYFKGWKSHSTVLIGWLCNITWPFLFQCRQINGLLLETCCLCRMQRIAVCSLFICGFFMSTDYNWIVGKPYSPMSSQLQLLVNDWAPLLVNFLIWYRLKQSSNERKILVIRYTEPHEWSNRSVNYSARGRAAGGRVEGCVEPNTIVTAWCRCCFYGNRKINCCQGGSLDEDHATGRTLWTCLHIHCTNVMFQED